MSGNPAGFVHYLYHLEQKPDTAALAKWRRGLGDSFGQISSAVLPELAHYSDDPAHYGRYALVGTLFARHRLHTAERESLGIAFKQLGQSDSLDKRFKTLLAARGDEIIVRLREAVGLAKSHEVAVDYASLLWDLLSWEDDGQVVQMRWAREYWFDAALRAPWEKTVQIALEKESERRKAAHRPERVPNPEEVDARIFAGYLQSLHKDRDRAALADLRQGLGKPWGTVDMLPYLAAFLPEQRRWEYPAYFLCAGLFGLHPLATDDAGHDMGRVFRFLGLQQAGKEASQSLQRRFTALLDANRRDLAHHLRQAASQAKSVKTPVAINYWRLLLDMVDWDNINKSVQRRWAKHFYFEPDTKADITEVLGGWHGEPPPSFEPVLPEEREAW